MAAYVASALIPVTGTRKETGMQSVIDAAEHVHQARVGPLVL